MVRISFHRAYHLSSALNADSAHLYRTQMVLPAFVRCSCFVCFAELKLQLCSLSLLFSFYLWSCSPALTILGSLKADAFR